MAPLTHDEVHARSYSLLAAARLKASKASGYDYKAFREEIARIFHERSGFQAHSWQLDATESVHLGLDTVVIAGTGKGKTTPFFMPLLKDPKKKAIIISPLIILQEDHAARFNKLDVPSVAVNGDSWNRQLRKDLIAGRYQGILASPEMCLKHDEFRRILTDGNFADISAIYIDEAHCISQWGGDFRKTYSKLSKLRSFFPPEIPMYATSATMPPACLREVRASLGIDAATSFTLNLGNDRPNIAYEVHEMKSSDDFIALKPHLSPHDNPSKPEDLRKTIIFTNTVAASQHATREIRSWLPGHLHNQVAYLHAHRSRKDKRRIMRRFRRGKIKILVATEAAGMGADIPDIKQVIQFGVPSSLSVWFQRAGRAGRSEGLEARAILLVEESMFKKQKSRAKKSGKGSSSQNRAKNTAVDEDEDEAEVVVMDEDGKEYKKKVDPALRGWIEIKLCRRDAADKYFNNPPGRTAPTAVCCDNCHRNALNALNIRPSTPTFDNTPSSTHTTPSKSKNANGKRPLVQEADVPDTSATKKTRRVKEHRKAAKQALESWRLNTFHRLYNPAPFTCTSFLPDKTLDALAAAKHMKTVEDMREVVKWVFVGRHGEEVLKVLCRVDDRREAAKQQKAAERKEETAAKNAEKKRADGLERESKRREAEIQKEEKRRAVEQEMNDRKVKKKAEAAARAAAKPPPKRPRRAAQPGVSVLNLSTLPAEVFTSRGCDNGGTFRLASLSSGGKRIGKLRTGRRNYIDYGNHM